MNFNKKYLCKVFLFYIITMIISGQIIIAAEIQLTPSIIDMNRHNINDTFDIKFEVSDVKQFGSFQFDIKYDPEIVIIKDMTSISIGNFLSSTGRIVEMLGPNIDNETGLTTVGAYSYSPIEGPSTDEKFQHLITANFQIRSKSRKSDIYIDKVLLSDVDANEITASKLSMVELQVNKSSDSSSSCFISMSEVSNLNIFCFHFILFSVLISILLNFYEKLYKKLK